MIEYVHRSPRRDANRLQVVATSSCAAAVPIHPADTPEAATAGPLETKRAWIAVGALALGAFVIVMTETLPVGLLPQIAAGLGVSVSVAGLMVLAPGITGAISAPLFFLRSGGFNRRPLIIALGLTVFVSNAVVAAAPNFVTVLAARVIFGATLGAFWTVVSPIGPRLVGPASGTRAITVIAAGISGGTVVGLPAGQFLGHFVGWRLTFTIAALATLLVVAAQALVLPSIPSTERHALTDLAGIVKRTAARFAMTAGAMVFIGQFAAWTFITPFFIDQTHLSSLVISGLYVAYGIGGILGSLLAGSLFKRQVVPVFAAAAAAVALLVIGMAWTGSSELLAGGLFVVWGLLWGIVNPGTLVWMLNASPATPEAASTMNVTNLQVALAIGSGLGAVLISTTDLETTFLVGGVIILGAAALAAVAARVLTAEHAE